MPQGLLGLLEEHKRPDSMCSIGGGKVSCKVPVPRAWKDKGGNDEQALIMSHLK